MSGATTVWTRLRYPLVPDEETGPLERVLAVADSGNGLSGELDITKWLFINPELTVHLHREATVSGSAWTRRPRSPRAGRAWPRPSSPIPPGGSAWEPSHC
jgi:hypothetical protein